MNRDHRQIGCQGMARVGEVDRRGVLKVGMLGALGLSLPELLRGESQARAAEARGSQMADQAQRGGKPARDSRLKSVVILYMRGGPSQLDTWDMKPDAPAEIRGEFAPRPTKVPGVQICELLPRSAAVMDKWSIVRSLHHRREDGAVDHSRGDQICFTGYVAGRDADTNIHPSVGSVVARQVGHLSPRMPAYVMIPRMIPGTGPAYLGLACRPFETQADPANHKQPFAVPNLAPPHGLAVERLGERLRLMREFDSLRRAADANGQMAALDRFHQQAFEIVTSPQARQAFDLDSEPRAVRERYGFYEPYVSRMPAGGDAPGWPQRVLLARRLVEAGVRLVTVDLRWWDTHDDNFWALKTGFLPRFDQAYSALIEDLDARGLLETTLVVAWGEHGRSPRISKSAGRDHWGNAFSAALAGGGVQGGRVVGASDSTASVPADNPKIPHDVLATIYRHLGIDTTVSYLDHTGRPHLVLSAGQPIDELF